MKNPNIKLLILFIFAFVNVAFSQNQKGVGSPTVSQLPAKEKRFALIIGVDTYQKDISPLYGTVNDAKALREVLMNYAGFADERIILMTTDSGDADLIPTRGNIIDQLDKLQRVVPADGLILFSFSGHGVSIGDDAFIVPSDGRIYRDADLMRERAIDVLRIKRAIQNTKVKQVIMFLDACRNDPVKGKGDVDNNLTTAYAKGFSFETKNQNIEAYATLYATSFGDRAYEFLDKKTNKYRGYFSYAIEEGLKGSAANDKGEVTLAGLIRYIEDTVKERVRINENQKQIPYPTTEGFRNSDLVIAVVEKNTPITTSQSTQRNGEQVFWQEIININSISGYERYLAEYPNGEFVRVAKLRLANLKWTNFKSIAQKLLKYDEIDFFYDDLASVREGKRYVGKYGFIDRAGNEIIVPKYGFAHNFSEGVAFTINVNTYYLIDKSGREIVMPEKYSWLDIYSEGLAKADVNGKTGFIDKSLKEVIPFQYDFAYSFSEGLASVNFKDKFGFIDKTGKEIISFKYEYAEPFAEGLAPVKLNGKWGYIDRSGKTVISHKYDLAVRFSEDLALVSLNGMKYFIDKTEKKILPIKNQSVWSFQNGLAKVRVGDEETGRLGFIDKTGKEIVPIKYNQVWCEAFIKDGFIGVILNGKKGFVDIYGNEYFDF